MASKFSGKRKKDDEPIVRTPSNSPAFVGGSFAPPLSDEKIEEYKEMIDGLEDGPVKESMTTLMNCCGVWWDLPEPEGTETSIHPATVGRKDLQGRDRQATIVRLQKDHADALDEHIPWGHELKGMRELFDSLPTGISGEEMHEGRRRNIVGDPEAKALRDAAFHLLWHVIELDLGREPTTTDKLG